MKASNIRSNLTASIAVVLGSAALIAVTFAHGQRTVSPFHQASEVTRPSDPGTNDLARVRIVSNGKIHRVSELVDQAKKLMSRRSDLDQGIKRDMLVTVYSDRNHTNLCWILFSAGIGKQMFSVHFDRSGKVVSERVALAIDQLGPDKP